jgi:hypothetical protein
MQVHLERQHTLVAAIQWELNVQLSISNVLWNTFPQECTPTHSKLLTQQLTSAAAAVSQLVTECICPGTQDLLKPLLASTTQQGTAAQM